MLTIEADTSSANARATKMIIFIVATIPAERFRKSPEKLFSARLSLHGFHRLTYLRWYFVRVNTRDLFILDIYIYIWSSKSRL